MAGTPYTSKKIVTVTALLQVTRYFSSLSIETSFLLSYFPLSTAKMLNNVYALLSSLNYKKTPSLLMTSGRIK